MCKKSHSLFTVATVHCASEECDTEALVHFGSF